MKKSSFLIAGKHAVTEALKNPNRRVQRVFLTEESKKTLHKDNKNLNLLKGIKLFFKNRKELDRLCSKEQISHQGLIAEIEHIEKISLKEYINSINNKKSVTLVALEDVTDPRNIGSIIRSAVSFNIDGLIIKERSFPSESKLLYKSASGCMEYINIFEVSNINTALRFLKTKNFWTSGFDKNGDKNFIDHKWDGNNVLLFGSESYGLKYQTKKNSDFLFRIDINNKVESLNISNSASVVFHYLNIGR
jgi:23S rRNA (guanosine2251-2'-O)-methyltransferase|tara:strand:+ start:17 stop:760 length:744 start_codon:yes stop_codon:yes gene_type:complete